MKACKEACKETFKDLYIHFLFQIIIVFSELYCEITINYKFNQVYSSCCYMYKYRPKL